MHMCSCLTLCDPMDCSLPGSSVQGIFQARTTEWVAISFSRGSSWPRDWTSLPSLLHWQDDSLTMHSLGSYKKCVYQCECECVCVYSYTGLTKSFAWVFYQMLQKNPKEVTFWLIPYIGPQRWKMGVLLFIRSPIPSQCVYVHDYWSHHRWGQENQPCDVRSEGWNVQSQSEG